jgi:hypothetical protein
LRRRLARLGERALLAVPAHTTLRALETPPPEDGGQGRRPPRPWPSVGAWSQALAEAAWRRRDVRDGSQGALVVEAVKRRVGSRPQRRQQGAEEVLPGIRARDRDQEEVVNVADERSNTVPETALEELARVAQAEHRLEACLQRSTREAGLADAEGRTGTGGQQPPTLSFRATWFLERETQRGKKMAPGHAGPADTPRHRDARTRGVSGWDEVA